MRAPGSRAGRGPGSPAQTGPHLRAGASDKWRTPGLLNQYPDITKVHHGGKRHRFNACPQTAEDLERVGKCRGRFRVGPQVGLEKVSRNANANVFQMPHQRGCEIGDRYACARGIGRIMPRNGLQQESAVACAARHWARGIKGRRERIDAGSADATVGGFQTRDAAESRWNPDRATGVGPQRGRGEAPRERCA